MKFTKISAIFTATLLLAVVLNLILRNGAEAAGTYTWISKPANGVRANAQTDYNDNQPSASADGRYIAYISRKADLTLSLTDGQPHPFLYDRNTGTNIRLDLDANNNPLGDSLGPIYISANGKYVTFVERETINGNMTYPTYVFDETTKTISVESLNNQGSNIAIQPHGISNNGILLFDYQDATPIVNNPYANSDLYLRDVTSNLITQVPQLSGFPGWSITEPRALISADGSTLAVILKDNLHQGSGLHIGLIKTLDWTAENISSSIDGPIQSSNVNSPLVQSISQNGRYVVLLVFNNYIWDDQTKTLHSLSSITDTPRGYAITDDGRYVASKLIDHTINDATLRFNLSILDRTTNRFQVVVPAADIDPDGYLYFSGYTFAPNTGQFIFDTGQNLSNNDNVQDTYDLYQSSDTPLRVDTTSPDITPLLSPLANINGWNNSNVIVSFNCTDDTAVASCSGPTTLSSEGANQKVTGTATDTSGNTASTTATVNIDKTAPTIKYTVSPSPNANGWNTGDVTVTFNCSDDLSGIDSCTSPITVGTEGGNQTVRGTAVDNAGNVKTIDVTVDIDKSAPTITYLETPAPNINGWNQDNVTISFLCDDSVSGIDTCSAPVTVSAEGANQKVTGTAVDKAGNTATVTATVDLDKTAPAINYSATPAANSNGWNNSDVAVSFTCDDALSGIDSCSGTATVSSEGANQSVTGTATDKAGNTSTTTATVSIDKTAPTITASVSPAPNSDGWNNSDVTVNFTCSDSLSGIDVCPSPVRLTEGAGQIITGTATDKAGNSASTSVMVNVDKTAPVVSNLSWSSNPLQQGQNTTLMATVTDGLSGIKAASYSVNGSAPQPMTYDPISGNYIVTFGSNLAANTYNITVTATDTAGNSSLGTNDVLVVYTTANGYVNGHAKALPTTTDALPIAKDTSNNPAKLVMGFTNVTAPMSGSFDLDYAVKNKQDEFSLSSTNISWVVVSDNTHASILGKADMTTWVNGAPSVTQSVSVRYDISLGTNGSADHVSVKIYNPGVDPNSGTPAYSISDDVIANGSNLMIHP